MKSERQLGVPFHVRSFCGLYAGRVIFPQVEGKSPEVGGEFLQQGVAEFFDHEIFRIPWSHHKILIDKFRRDPDRALFYVRETLKNGWSRAVLLNFIDTDLYTRQGLESTSQPIGVSEYRLSVLPSAEEIESRLNGRKDCSDAS